MDKELWIPLMVVAIPGVISLATQAASIFSARRESRANAKTKEASASQVNVDTSLRLMQKLEARVSKLEKQIVLQEETIKYLFDGTMKNIEAMETAGLNPPFRPAPIFRGNNGDEFDFEV